MPAPPQEASVAANPTTAQAMAKRAICFLVRQVRPMRASPASAHSPAYSAGCEGPRPAGIVGRNRAAPMPLVVMVRNEVCPAATGFGLKEAAEQLAPAGSVEETHCRNTWLTAGFAGIEIL